MPTLIKNIRQLHIVEFGQGNFDEWCVYLQRNGQQRYAPIDTEYFTFFQNKANKLGKERIYNDFVSIYTPTTTMIDANILSAITAIADTYGNDAVEMDIWLTVIYGGMVAEENKANMILKKRIKRLGIHQVIIENMQPHIAANFSKGKKWRELDALMRERGF